MVDIKTSSLSICSPGLGVTLALILESGTKLYSVMLAKGTGQSGRKKRKHNQNNNTGMCGAEQSGPGAEEQAYDSLLYPLAIGGHFI